MTNGEKLLATFEDSKVNTDFIWAVGFVVKAGNQKHTFIIDREWWDSEYSGMSNDDAYKKGWSDALEALEGE